MEIKNRPIKEELEEAQTIAREGIEKAKEVLPKQEEVKVGFGWARVSLTS